MKWYFPAACIGLLLMLPFYYLSLNHFWMERRYGTRRGREIGELLGRISGWGFFLFWFSLWIVPQPGYSLLPDSSTALSWKILWCKTNILHLLLSLPLWIGAWYFGLAGVCRTGLKTAETHRTETIVTSGVYSCLRHPQYFGGLLAHAACSLLLSSLYAAIAFPAACLLIYAMAKTEEYFLVKEFGNIYNAYKRHVPMFIPNPAKCLKHSRKTE